VSVRTWLATDYYELLGVDREASAEEISRAFRASAKDHHPDRTDDAPAMERFKALSVAYGVLGNPERRARYDGLRLAPTDSSKSANPPMASGIEERPPLSVRALPERRHGRWASIGGIVLLVAGALAVGFVLWLASAGPGGTTNGSDPTGRNLTLGLVAVKLVVVGIVFVVLGNRRLRHP
jgi:hypothetical protein